MTGRLGSLSHICLPLVLLLLFSGCARWRTVQEGHRRVLIEADQVGAQIHHRVGRRLEPAVGLPAVLKVPYRYEKGRFNYGWWAWPITGGVAWLATMFVGSYLDAQGRDSEPLFIANGVVSATAVTGLIFCIVGQVQDGQLGIVPEFETYVVRSSGLSDQRVEIPLLMPPSQVRVEMVPIKGR